MSRLLAEPLLSFYRLRSEQSLVSGQRAVLYTVLGYCLTAQHGTALLIANTGIVALLFMFFGAYDNYWDWRVWHEANGTGRFIEARRLAPAAGLLLSYAPWVFILPALALARTAGMSAVAELCFWLMTALGFLYITPGLRLKERSISFFIAPVWACLLLVQASTLSASWQSEPLLMALCVAVFLVQCQAELLHRVDDALQGTADATSVPLATLLAWLRWLPLGSAVGFLIGGWRLNPLLFNSVFWSLVKGWSLRRLTADRVPALRKQLWHPAWSLYEFGLYAAVGLWRGGL